VLLLPVLPAAIAADLARIVTAHVTSRHGGDVQVLLTRLRTAISPHVPPPALDDVALFLNEARYRTTAARPTAEPGLPPRPGTMPGAATPQQDIQADPSE
jgi:hypothetical protein